MQDVTSRIIFILISAVIVLGVAAYFWKLFQEPESKVVELQPHQTERPPLRSFSSEKYSFQYPPEYSVIEVGEGKTYILTVSKDEKSKLEIFKADEYPGDRAAFGFTGHETAEQAEEYVEGVEARNPKEYLKIGEINDSHDVWLYYEKGDDETKKELKEIFETIKVQ